MELRMQCYCPDFQHSLSVGWISMYTLGKPWRVTGTCGMFSKRLEFTKYVYDTYVSLLKSNFFFVFTKNQTSIQHPPSRSGIIIPSTLGRHEESSSPGWKGPRPQRSLSFTLINDAFRRALLPLRFIRQDRICSLSTVIYYGSSIILNRLPLL